MPIINPGTGGGSPGPQGIPGINGIPGFDGDSGEDGFPIPGSAGPAGSSGAQGIPGINGNQGIPGEDGLSGEDSFIPGPQGLAGTNGTNGTIGRDGARGLDGEDGLVSDDFWPGFNPFIDDPLEQISRIQDQNLTIRPSYSAIVVGPYTINSGKKLTIGSGGRFKIEQGAPDAKASVFVKQTTTFNYSGTVPAGQMAGLGVTSPAQVVTPRVSGTLLLTLSAYANLVSGTVNDFTVKLWYGTGSAPSAGSSIPPASGIQIGNQQKATMNLSANFSVTVLLQNLNSNTQYWFDMSIEPTGVGSVSINFVNANFVALEQ